MKMKLTLHVRKYRIFIEKFVIWFRKKEAGFFSIFSLQGIVSYFPPYFRVNEIGEVKLFFMIGKITTLTLSLTTKGCLSKISKTADGFMLKRKLDPFLLNAF